MSNGENEVKNPCMEPNKDKRLDLIHKTLMGCYGTIMLQTLLQHFIQIHRMEKQAKISRLKEY